VKIGSDDVFQPLVVFAAKIHAPRRRVPIHRSARFKVSPSLVGLRGC
jgi:hypothetical protein